MNKLSTRRILKQFSDGKLSGREAVCELGLDDFSEVIVLLQQHRLVFPPFSPVKLGEERAEIFSFKQNTESLL